MLASSDQWSVASWQTGNTTTTTIIISHWKVSKFFLTHFQALYFIPVFKIASTASGNDKEPQSDGTTLSIKTNQFGRALTWLQSHRINWDSKYKLMFSGPKLTRLKSKLMAVNVLNYISSLY